jgi:staphylococcal nuclease domain-containing protein 1
MFSFIKLPSEDSEYYQEALERFKDLCQGRKLIANIDSKDGGLLHLRLMDPSNTEAAADPLASINSDLLGEGLASLDRKGVRYANAYPTVVKKLRESINLAKRDRLGMYELGDVEEDD